MIDNGQVPGTKSQILLCFCQLYGTGGGSRNGELSAIQQVDLILILLLMSSG